MGAHSVVLELLQIPYEKVQNESGLVYSSLISVALVEWLSVNASQMCIIQPMGMENHTEIPAIQPFHNIATESTAWNILHLE